MDARYEREHTVTAATEDKTTTDSHLTRTAAFTVTRTEDDNGDGLTLEGYGAVFNEPTRIDSWEGRFDEIIAPGAFKRTIDRKGPKGIRLQFDHGAHPLIGSLPLGTISELREDDRGLFIRARLSSNWLVEPFRDAIRDGAVDGMSFRFRVVNDEWDETDPDLDLPVRTLKELELFEVGPVVWPAYEQTSVGVRARQIAQELMDPEQRIEVARALLVGTSTEDEGASDGPTEQAPSDSPSESREEPASPSDTQDASDNRAEQTIPAPAQAKRPRLSREEMNETLERINRQVAAITEKEQAHA